MPLDGTYSPITLKNKHLNLKKCREFGKKLFVHVQALSTGFVKTLYHLCQPSKCKSNRTLSVLNNVLLYRLTQHTVDEKLNSSTALRVIVYFYCILFGIGE